jgi:hypothetical protein
MRNTIMVTQQANPARTYATPSRAVNSVEKMHVEAGGKPVKFVISKDTKGRYFPVFVGRIDPVSQEEIDANPSANKARQAIRRGDRDVQAKPARKTAQKRTARKTAAAEPARRGRPPGKKAAKKVAAKRGRPATKKAAKKATKRKSRNGTLH